jgi:hypothetical protein
MGCQVVKMCIDDLISHASTLTFIYCRMGDIQISYEQARRHSSLVAPLVKHG